jgi:hypothetical protein
LSYAVIPSESGSADESRDLLLLLRKRYRRDSSTSRPDGNREDTISGSKRLGTLRSE